MPEKIPEGARVVVRLAGEIYYDNGATDHVSIRVGDRYGATISVPRDAIVETRPPAQKPGAVIWHVGDEAWMTVVLHDAASGKYVLRTKAGDLVMRLDDSDILPEPEARELHVGAEQDPEFAEAPAPPEIPVEFGGPLVTTESPPCQPFASVKRGGGPEPFEF